MRLAWKMTLLVAVIKLAEFLQEHSLYEIDLPDYPDMDEFKPDDMLSVELKLHENDMSELLMTLVIEYPTPTSKTIVYQLSINLTNPEKPEDRERAWNLLTFELLHPDHTFNSSGGTAIRTYFGTDEYNQQVYNLVNAHYFAGLDIPAAYTVFKKNDQIGVCVFVARCGSQDPVLTDIVLWLLGDDTVFSPDDIVSCGIIEFEF